MSTASPGRRSCARRSMCDLTDAECRLITGVFVRLLDDGCWSTVDHVWAGWIGVDARVDDLTQPEQDALAKLPDW